VSVESKGIKLQIDPDARLAAGAGAVARYLADSSGLASEAAAEFQKSIIAICLETFQYLSGSHPHLTVNFARFADHLEVAVAHQGEEAPALGLEQIAGFANQLGGSSTLGGIDRVQYEARDGMAVTRLTKYLELEPPLR
jgi:hypothetical protein